MKIVWCDQISSRLKNRYPVVFTDLLLRYVTALIAFNVADINVLLEFQKVHLTLCDIAPQDDQLTDLVQEIKDCAFGTLEGRWPF